MLRAFTDSSGTEWRVWDVLPSATTASFSAGNGSLASLMGTAYAAGLATSSVYDTRIVSITRSFAARNARPVSVISTTASAMSGTFASVAP